jgi:arabinogalactan oligomer/maltooligosaccharide transport system permease protein
MGSIVFIPLIQGISFSFTNASDKNIAKMRPKWIPQKGGGKKQIKEVIPPQFEYVALENYVEIFTGKSKRERNELSDISKQVNEYIPTLKPTVFSNGYRKIVLKELLNFDDPNVDRVDYKAEVFITDLKEKFSKTVNGVTTLQDIVSYANNSTEKNFEVTIILPKNANWKEVVKKVYMPRKKDARFYKVFARTLVWTFVNVFFHFMIGLGLALLLNRKIAFRSGYRLLLLLPWGVPSVVSAFSWRWLFNYDFGFVNYVLTVLGMKPLNWLSDPTLMLVAAIITNIWLGFPFMVVTLLGGLQTIPNELYESARVDGANAWQQFWHITMPMLKPVALTVTLLGTIWTFNMFNIIFLVTQAAEDADILVTFAFRAAFRYWQIGNATAYSVVILGILLFFSYFYWRMIEGQKEAR